MSVTVTVNEHIGPTVVVHVTVVVPTGKNDPPAGVQTTVPQLPVVVGANFTAAPHCPAVAGVVMFAGHMIMHAGCTVTVNVH